MLREFKNVIILFGVIKFHSMFFVQLLLYFQCLNINFHYPNVKNMSTRTLYILVHILRLEVKLDVRNFSINLVKVYIILN